MATARSRPPLVQYSADLPFLTSRRTINALHFGILDASRCVCVAFRPLGPCTRGLPQDERDRISVLVRARHTVRGRDIYRGDKANTRQNSYFIVYCTCRHTSN